MLTVLCSLQVYNVSYNKILDGYIDIYISIYIDTYSMKQNNYQYQEIITITTVIQRFLEYLRAISFSLLFMILQYNTKIHHLKQEKCVRENLCYSYFQTWYFVIQ